LTSVALAKEVIKCAAKIRGVFVNAILREEFLMCWVLVSRFKVIMV